MNIFILGGVLENNWPLTIKEEHYWFILYLILFLYLGYCETYFDSFDDLCMSIAGDSPMYSMIRRHGAPEPCPFHGPHTFSYAKGKSILKVFVDLELWQELKGSSTLHSSF